MPKIKRKTPKRKTKARYAWDRRLARSLESWTIDVEVMARFREGLTRSLIPESDFIQLKEREPTDSWERFQFWQGEFEKLVEDTDAAV